MFIAIGQFSLAYALGLETAANSISRSIRYVVASPWPLQHCLRLRA
jgi:hypothetical protein